MGSRFASSFGDMAHDFDLLFDDVDELADLEALSLHHILSESGARSVLDCACGTGIQAIGLAMRGYRVCASDISPEILGVLTAKAAARCVDIDTRVSDFRCLTEWRDQQFDAVICCGNSLPLVPHRKDIFLSLLAMKGKARHPGGIVIIGLHNYERVRQEGKGLLVRRVRSAPERQELLVDLRTFGKERVRVRYLLFRGDGHTWNETRYTKLYWSIPPADLGRRMETAGFRRVRTLDVTATREFRDDEWALVVGET